jgi:hypothetical protein
MEAALVNISRKQLLWVEDIHFNPDKMIVLFEDGEELPVPLAWFPKLYYATPHQLSNWRLSNQGLNIYWPLLNIQVSISSLIGR